jgi:tetratricopeptide (TPR) repeat protein
MKKNLINHLSTLFTFVLVITSCSKDSTLNRLDYIKILGNEEPEKALVMLDSMEIEMRNATDYTKHKYDLLRIRLNDKANHIPSSDLMIKELVDYFETEGTIPDKQEVYYYAGSVYRDLKDTPRSLEFFFKSLECSKMNNRCDSTMLRNTYSNLGYLYFDVQDYNNAFVMAQKELDICKKIHGNEILSYMHMGANYLALDSLHQAKVSFDMAYQKIVSSKKMLQYQDLLINLLNYYSILQDMPKAQTCFSLINQDNLKDFSAFTYMAFAHYYELIGELDSATIYCQRILDDGTDIDEMYDASKLLFQLYHKIGNEEKTNIYAQKYMELSDSIDFGKRQELAATVNNSYQYHLDLKREQSLKDEKKRSINMLIVVSLLSILIISIGISIYIRGKNKYLKRIVALSSDLQKLSCDEKQLREEIKRKEEQNKAFIKILHQSELQVKAEEVITSIKQSSTGKKNMNMADWKMLYQAVNELYPFFHDKLLKELGDFNEQQMQFCYLVRIGLSNTQIQNVMELSRATVWRWKQKYDWVLSFETQEQGSLTKQ